MNVFALGFKFEPKPKNLKKPKSLDTLKYSKRDKKILWKTYLKKSCYLESVTLDLSVVPPYQLEAKHGVKE